MDTHDHHFDAQNFHILNISHFLLQHQMVLPLQEHLSPAWLLFKANATKTFVY